MRIDQAKGAVHDFRLFKESLGAKTHESIRLVMDSGYQGVKKIHFNSFTPKKKPRGGELSDQDKAYNRALSRFRDRECPCVVEEIQDHQRCLS